MLSVVLILTNDDDSSSGSKTPNIFFVDAPGGTGKTFIIYTLLSLFRSQHKFELTTLCQFKVPSYFTNRDYQLCTF